MANALLVAAGTLSHVTLAAATFTIGWRRGRRRRPAQRVRIDTVGSHLPARTR